MPYLLPLVPVMGYFVWNLEGVGRTQFQRIFHIGHIHSRGVLSDDCDATLSCERDQLNGIPCLRPLWQSAVRRDVTRTCFEGDQTRCHELWHGWSTLYCTSPWFEKKWPKPCRTFVACSIVSHYVASCCVVFRRVASSSSLTQGTKSHSVHSCLVLAHHRLATEYVKQN